MPMDASKIKDLLRESFPESEIDLRDLAGDGDHYALNLISEKFVGKTRIQQHQMVYEALKGSMDGELHALALQTSPPKTD